MAYIQSSGGWRRVDSLDDTFEALGALMSENKDFLELFNEEPLAASQPSNRAPQQHHQHHHPHPHQQHQQQHPHHQHHHPHPHLQHQQQHLQQEGRQAGQPEEGATVDVLAAMAHYATQLEVSDSKLEVCRLRLQEANAGIKDLEAKLAHYKRLVAAMALRGGAAASGTAATQPLAPLVAVGQEELKPLLQQAGQQDVAGLLRQLGARYPVLVGMGIRALICNAKVWRTLPQMLDLRSVSTPQQLRKQQRRAAGAKQQYPPVSFTRSSTCSQFGVASTPSSTAVEQTAVTSAQHSVAGPPQQAQQAAQAGEGGWGGPSSRAAQSEGPTRKRLRCEVAQAEPLEALQQQEHTVAHSRAGLKGFEALYAEPTAGDFVRAIRVLMGQRTAAT